jgi:hypothetical protein
LSTTLSAPLEVSPDSVVNLTSTITTGFTPSAPSDQPVITDLASYLSVPSSAAQSPSGDHEEFLRLLHSNISLHQATQAPMTIEPESRTGSMLKRSSLLKTLLRWSRSSMG